MDKRNEEGKGKSQASMGGTNAPIAIIGAGISGLTLARDLLRRGIPSTVYDKAPPPKSTSSSSSSSSSRRHNYGISLSAGSCTSLSLLLSTARPDLLRRQIAVNNGHSHGHAVSNVPTTTTTTTPSPTSPYPRGEGGGGGGQIRGLDGRRDGKLRAHRGRLEALLAAGLDVRWAHDLSSISPLPPLHGHDHGHDHGHGLTLPLPPPPPLPTTNKLKLAFNNGAEATASLVVGADGVHSAVRTLVASHLQPRVLPYVVFRGQRRVRAAEFARAFAPALVGGEGDVLELRRDGFVLLVAVDDRDAHGGALISWFYSRRAHSDRDLLYRPHRAVNEANLIPDDFFAEVSRIAGLEEPFNYICDPDMMRRDRIQNFLMRHLLPDGEHFKELADLGIVFIGDAAHAIPIVGSEGADYAIQDALDLADVLDVAGGIRASTEERATVQFEQLTPATRDHLGSMILNFYDTKLSGREGPSSWNALVERAKEVLVIMHNT